VRGLQFGGVHNDPHKIKGRRVSGESDRESGAGPIFIYIKRRKNPESKTNESTATLPAPLFVPQRRKNSCLKIVGEDLVCALQEKAAWSFK